MIVQVPGEGPKDCQIAIIGEAPGANEAAKGKPFIGAAGRMLDGLLANAGIARSQCYITNVIKERPPRNNVEKYIKISRSSVKTTPEYEEHERFLMKELAEVGANVLVPMGNVSIYALTKRFREGVTKLRGSILEATGPLAGRKVIPTIHPAAALREHNYTYWIVRDLRRIKQQSEFPEVKLPQRELIISPSYDTACKFLETLVNEGLPVSVDIEFFNNQVSCIAFSNNPSYALCIPLVCSEGDYWSLEHEAHLWKLIGLLLEDESIPKVFQNAIYDTTILHRQFGFITKPIEDTMVAYGIYHPDFPKGLDFLCSMLTEEPYYKGEVKNWIKLVGMNFDDLWQYNARDAAVTIEIWQKLMPMLERMGNERTYKHQVSTIPVLSYMEERGFPVNITGLKAESVQLESDLEHLQTRINEVAGVDLNPLSPKQLMWYFYEEKGLKPYLKQGRPTTDEKALKRLSGRGFEEAKFILEYRQKSKLRSTYLEMDLDDDERVRGSYNPVGTVSGRFSSSKTPFGTGGNMQNLDPKFLVHCHADDGYVLICQDLERAENRCVAWLGPVPNMKRAFEAGVDVHKLTAALIFGVRLEDVSDEEGSCPAIGDGSKSQRFWGKTANHALNYGMGAGEFSVKYEIPMREARSIIERYHGAYPDVRSSYHRNIQAELSNGRTITNPYGRKRVFLGRWGDQLFKSAYSHLPQSIVAYKINQEGLLFLYSLDEPVELLMQVHDSIVYQVPLRLGWKKICHIVTQVKDSLETPVPTKEPFVIPVETAIGYSFAKKKFTPSGLRPVELTPEKMEETWNEIRLH